MSVTACGTCEPDGLPMGTRITIVTAFFMFFCLFFVVSWFLMERYYERFRSLSLAVKADNCSRVNSTIHSIIVVPTLFVGVLTTEWGESKEPLSSVAFLQSILCVTIAYFLCDTLIMVLYRVPLWGVYLTHHLLAVAPYIIYMFVSPCGYGLFLLSCFMLVEFSNFSLNTQAWLEQNGKANTRAYALCFYATFFGWIACRIVNPYLMVYYAHAAIYPSIPAGHKWCFIPSLCCGYLIVLFCTSVFIFVWCASLKKRWSGPEAAFEVAKHDKADLIRNVEEGNGNDAAKQTRGSCTPTRPSRDEAGHRDRAMDTSSDCRTMDTPPPEALGYEGMESPTRTMAHEAEKKFNELAAAARERANSLGFGGGGGAGGRRSRVNSNDTAEPLSERE